MQKLPLPIATSGRLRNGVQPAKRSIDHRKIHIGPNITTPSITVTPAGGTGPYTCAWNPVGVPPDVWIINTPGSATTSFTAQGIYGGPAYSAVAQFSCSVTDALGVISTSPTVSATARNSYAGPRNLPGGGVLP